MTKEEYIKYWIEQANDDWGAVDTLFNGNKNLQSLFFAHLTIEKLCKSFWIKSNKDNVPPKTHNLNYILSQTNIELPDNYGELLLNLNRFQIEGRYPEYISKMSSLCTKDFTKDILIQTNELRLWLIEKLQ